jgi:hypothetical protein
MALAVLVPVLASADDAKPYVVNNGRQATAASNSSGAAGAAKTNSAFGAPVIRPGIASGRASSARSLSGTRAGGTRGILGGAPVGGAPAGGGSKTGATTTAATAPPPYATPGAKIISAGQQPVYTAAAPSGTSSVNGGGLIAIDQGRANDAERGPGISWAPPDSPQSGSRSGGGSGATTNGPVFNAASQPAPPTAKNTSNGATGATGFNPSF